MSRNSFIDVASYLPSASKPSIDAWPAGPQQSGAHVTRYGLSAFASRSEYREPVRLTVTDSENRLHLSVWLRDGPDINLDGRQFSVSGRQTVVGYLPDVPWKTQWRGRAHQVGLLLPLDALPELAGEQGFLFAERLRRSSNLRVEAAHAKVLRAAHELDGILISTASSVLLREAKSLELLALLIDSAIDDRRNVFTRAQRERLELARALLLARIDCAPTIAELAHACGTNTFQLKQDFKRMFGVSVHALYQQERMHHAWQLIESGKTSAAEAGRQVGYTNLSHFGAAFQKQFGILPGELKRRPMA